MVDTKTAFRNVLIGDSAITTLVPATRITMSWPVATSVFPLIVYREIDNRTESSDYFDNLPFSERSTMSVDIFTAPNTDPYSIAAAVDSALNLAYWNRDGSEDLIESDGKMHKVLRYSKRIKN